MPATAPNTLAIAQAVIGYMQALIYSGGQPVYSLVQLNKIKDVTGYIANGQACLEVYGATDDSQHKTFSGGIWDEQSWYLLSIVSIDDAAAGEALLYQVRDALVQPLQSRFQLGGAGNVFFSRIKAGSGHFLDLTRNDQDVRAHQIEIYTSAQWQVTLNP